MSEQSPDIVGAGTESRPCTEPAIVPAYSWTPCGVTIFASTDRAAGTDRRRDRAIRLANEQCDLVQVRSGQHGTTVRIHTPRSPQPTPETRSLRR